MKKTGIIILAAGSSSRLGTPKQLLAFEGKSLLRRIAEEASLLPEHRVMVVLGSSYEAIHEELAGTEVKTVFNSDWEDGMSGSIRTGLLALLQAHPDLEQCIITVCDQPYVNAPVFDGLKRLHNNTGKGIITTAFADTWGVPVLISDTYFDELLSLNGQEGAKNVIKKHLDDMATFPFEPARFDIDTRADYYSLKKEMVSVTEAKEIIDFYLPESNITKDVPLQDALGYTLASDVVAQYDIPAFAQSSMDGYAIRYEDREQHLQVVDKIPAGSTVQKTLPPGKAMRIFTGAPLPRGADTVVMQEKVEVNEDGTIAIQDEELVKGSNVRPKGSEVDKGATAMQKGTVLTPAAVGYLAGTGCTYVDIFAVPRVALILTGNELKPLGEPLGFGEVYESNSYQLRSALQQIGIGELDIFHTPDDIESLKEIMENALEDVDVLLLVGGVSVGEFDFVTKAAKECGVVQRFHRIRQKPGKPLFFGTKGEKLIFGLPGNPSSALTCFYLYVAPALEKMMQIPHRIKNVKVPISHDYRKKAGLTHFLKGSYDGSVATALHAQESYRLQSFAQANCLLVLEEDSEGCHKGDEIYVYLISP